MIALKIWFLGASWTVITKTSLSLPISRESWWRKSVPTKAFTSGVRCICYKGKKIQICEGNEYYESYVCWGLHKCKSSYLSAVLLHRSHSVSAESCCGSRSSRWWSLFLSCIFVTLYSYWSPHFCPSLPYPCHPI